MFTTDFTTTETTDDGQTPPLRHGERMDQPTFHARYSLMPEDFKAELIGGVVYVASPARLPHGRSDGRLITWLGIYSDATPGTDYIANTTTILGEDSEPQPDAALFIEGGQTHEDDASWLVGAPELIAEVANSSVRLDLITKRADYERRGVQEYIVVVIPQNRIAWFVRENDAFVEMQPDADGIYRSRVFPGLWLDAAAFLGRDGRRVTEVLQQGLASAGHAAFVERLRSH